MNKYKKQLNKSKKQMQVGMVGPKSKQSRIASWQDASLQQQSFYENLCRDASCQLAILVCLHFGPTIPTCFFNYFLYLFMFFFF